MTYIKQLDSIRAIAVLLVILSHWFEPKSIVNILPNGDLGVDIFFVLSGYLITNILLDSKIKNALTNKSNISTLKSFYWRRSLRIFPIYYLTIFVLYFFSKQTGTHIKSEFTYFLTYTSNFYFYLKGWDGMISHLWSLSVEEQFYLIWPWTILFANKKYLLHTILFFIAIGVISGFFMSRLITITSFNAFGLGALLAWQQKYQPILSIKFKKVINILVLASLCVFIIGIVTRKWDFIPLRNFNSFLALWVINYIVTNHNNDNLKLKTVLNNSILIFIGKISYGVYLFHNIIPFFTRNVVNKKLVEFFPFTYRFTNSNKVFIIENFFLLIAISWLSYNLIEKRFLYLKKYFNY